LKISYLEAMLLGSVLAAVSPAIVAPRMINLINEGYGKKHHVPELILAGSSCDDIFVIVLFYSFKSLVSSNSFERSDKQKGFKSISDSDSFAIFVFYRHYQLSGICFLKYGCRLY